MSTAYSGNYSFTISDLETNSKKRYELAVQKGKPILDKELSEIAFRDLNLLRNFLMNNIGDGAIGTAFKIVESSISNINNFKITGGTATSPAILVVKGYPLVLWGDIEFNQQNDLGALTDDNYTKSAIIPVNTPVGARTDEVYVDTYLAEVSSEVGSEYQDTSIKDPVLALQTANRFRIVQDIQVAEGGVTPTDGNDGNGIYHRYYKLATINRLAGDATITTAMITDNRTVVNSLKSYQDGTAGSILLANGSSIGDDTHRVSQIFMASSIDYKTNDLMIKNNGTERMRITTGGQVGIGTTIAGDGGNCPLTINRAANGRSVVIQVAGVAQGWLTSDATALYLEAGSSKKLLLSPNAGGVSGITIETNGNVGLSSALTVGSNLTVNGTTTTINTETTTTDKMEINQDENQEALIINKSATGIGTAVRIINAGTAPALTVTGATATVSIGTESFTSEGEKVRIHTDTNSTILRLDWQDTVSSTNTASIRFGRSGWTTTAYVRGQADGTGTINGGLVFGVYPFGDAMSILQNGRVGIGTAAQATLEIYDDSATFEFRKKTVGPAVGDSIGQIHWIAKTPDGNDHTAGAISLNAEATWVNGSTYSTYLAFLNSSGSTTGIERMRINSNGLVGIGSTAPQSRIDVYTTTEPALNVNRSAVSSTNAIATFANGTTELVRIGLNGFVGIGSAAPGDMLDIVGATGNPFIRLKSMGLDSTPGLQLINDARTWIVKVAGDNADSFVIRDTTASSDRLVIKSNSFVGIGTTNPISQLHVAGSQIRVASYGSSYAEFYANDGTNGLDMGVELAGGSLIAGSGAHEAVLSSSGTYKMHFGTNNVIRMTIDENGRIGIGSTSPTTVFNVVGNATYAHAIIAKAGTTGGWGGVFYDNDSSVEVDIANSNYAATFNGGKVGIGTDAPNFALTVKPLTDADAISIQRYTDAHEVVRIGVSGAVGTSRAGWIGGYNASGTNTIWIDADGQGHIGIGTDNPLSNLHVRTSATGAGFSPFSTADDLLVESSGDTGITIGCGTNSLATIAFGKSGNSIANRIVCTQSENSVLIIANGSPVCKFRNNGIAVGQTYSDLNTPPSNGAIFEGSVGIGTTNPETALFVAGDSPILTVNNTADNQRAYLTKSYLSFSPANTAGRTFIDSVDGTYLVLKTGSIAGGSSEQMRITDIGRVGIGTNNPQSSFHVSGTVILGGLVGAGNTATCHINSESGTTPLTVYKPTASPASYLIEGRSNVGSANNLVFAVSTGGQIYSDAGTTITSPADLAEWTKVIGNLENYECGDVVMQSSEDLTVEKAQGSPEVVYGIITDRGAFCGGIVNGIKQDITNLLQEEYKQKYNAYKIAMTGHVKCKVKGTIKKGQRLSLSNEAGVAKAAFTFEEKVFAFAIARQDYNSEVVGLIEVRLM